MTKFSFNYHGKKHNVDVIECKTKISQIHGLMFKKKSKPLLFIYNNKTREGIHSFFCVPFICIWFDGDKIIDIRYVKPWRVYVAPKRKFDKFLEIPRGCKEFLLFSDEIRKV